MQRHGWPDVEPPWIEAGRTLQLSTVLLRYPKIESRIMIPRSTPFHPFTGKDVPWLVDMQATLRPSANCLVWESFAGPRRTWTFAEFAQETKAYAAGLVDHGITAEDTVIIHLENCPEFLFLWHACARIGALVVTTNTNSSPDEFDYFARHSRAVAVITQPKLLRVVKATRAALRWIACTATDADALPEVPRSRSVIAVENLRSNATIPLRESDPMRPNSVQYTSGTTARPKGVVWTHANALWTGNVGSSHLRLTDEDSHIFYFPLFHTNALGYSHLATLWSGGTAVLLPRFSASRFWEIAVRNRCTWASHVMFTLNSLAAQPDPPGHGFRFWIAGSENPLVRDRWGIKSIGVYGMTETITHVHYNDRALPGMFSSMGVVANEYQVSVRSPDGENVGFGEQGRLWVKGVAGISLFREYLHNHEATEAAFDEDGWFDTGDLVVPLSNGEFVFSSREKDMLRVGGENVAAIEIETVILGMPRVSEVAVVGRPDHMYDEVPVAFVVASDGAEGLVDAIYDLCARMLSSFKRPREVHVVDALPKGLLDKVLKSELRARLAEGREGQAQQDVKS